MADDAKAEETLDQVREAFAQSIRETIRDVPAHVALQLADQLCTVQLSLLAGLRVTYRKTPEVDGAAIASDWRAGLSVGEIIEKRRCSRSVAYKYHPNKAAIRAAKAG